MTRLDPSSLECSGVRRILEILPEARFVGGCVRDLLLGRPIADIDMASPLEPRTVMERAEAVGIKAVPTGIDHGTVTLVADHRPVEVTTLRRDVSTDGRRATVAFTDCWQEDAARRDFTMNALSLESDGTLHDYFGGESDARAGRVRFIGDARTRIGEDSLRILRFYRFSAQLGVEIVDDPGHAACVLMRDRIGILSIERVRDEILKLLGAPNPLPMLRLMETDGILAEVHKGACVSENLIRLIEIEAVLGKADPFRRLFCLAGVCGAEFKLSNAQIARIGAMAGPDIEDLPSAVYRLGRQTVEDRMILRARDATALRGRLAQLAGQKDPVFPVAARDLMARGYVAGPDLGAALKALEARWLESGCSLDRKTLLA